MDVRFSTALVSLATGDDGSRDRGERRREGQEEHHVQRQGRHSGGGRLPNRDLQERFLHTRKLNVARGGGDSICTGDTILAAEKAGAALEKTYGYCPCEYGGGTHANASRPAKQDKFDQNTAFKFGLYGCLLWTPRASASSARACCAIIP